MNFVALKLPVKSIDLSEDQSTGTIEAERDGALIFSVNNEAGLSDFIQMSFLFAVKSEQLDLIELIAETHYNLRNSNSHVCSNALELAICKNAVKLLNFRKDSRFSPQQFENLSGKALNADSVEIYELLSIARSKCYFSAMGIITLHINN